MIYRVLCVRMMLVVLPTLIDVKGAGTVQTVGREENSNKSYR
jgi:hypothetical protein